MAGRRAIGLVLAVGLVAAGCAAGMEQKGGMEQKPAAAEQKSLYERLGGRPAIEAVVDDFIGNVAADGRINQRFANANIPTLKTRLVDQICEATGGPCTYTGQSMRDAHVGMKITDAEFNALVEDLVKSLDTFKVGATEKNQLLSALGSMRPDIVGR